MESDNILSFLKTSLFLAMVVCLALQSFTNFKKFISCQTSIAESEVERNLEPLPAFSICPQPAFDFDYMKTQLLPSDFFLVTYAIENEINAYLDSPLQFPFPIWLSEVKNSTESLEAYWNRSILSPIRVMQKDVEIKENSTVYSPWYGQCRTYVSTIPKKAKEKVPIVIFFQR